MKLEGDIQGGVSHYKKALLYNAHHADAMYNLGVAYGEMLKFDQVEGRNGGLGYVLVGVLGVFCHVSRFSY